MYNNGGNIIIIMEIKENPNRTDRSLFTIGHSHRKG